MLFKDIVQSKEEGEKKEIAMTSAHDMTFNLLIHLLNMWA